VRPSVFLSLIGAIVFALGTVAMAMFMYLDRNSAKPWHFWIAPLLSLAAAGALIQLAISYWVKVGRLETKGRPRSE
jgi:heme/copper-type cytochrome/quinol oxidase subunit 4